MLSPDNSRMPLIHIFEISNKIFFVCKQLINKTTFKYSSNIIFVLSFREDMYAQDSIDLLQNSGLQFRKHEEDGIEPLEFAELLMSSGKIFITYLSCAHWQFIFRFKIINILISNWKVLNMTCL